MSEYWRLRPNQEQLERLQKAIKKYGTQGVITLPKEDKYEEFKKWFMGLGKIPTKIDLRECSPIPPSPVYCKLEVNREKVFEEFESEWCEKEKEKRIKNVINYALKSKRCCDKGADAYTDKIYDELNEKGLLK